MELRHLRYLLAVSEQGHFGRAAAQLGIAQPSLSQQIRRLESLVGHRLLERRPQVRPTPSGEALLEVARRVLDQVDSGLERVAEIGGGHAGTLTVGFAASILPTPLAGALRMFRESRPSVDLRLRELSTAALRRALLDGIVDVGFLREPEEWPDIDREILLREPFAVVLPAGHPLAARKRIDLASMAAEPFVHFPREVAPVLFDRIRALCGRAGFAPRVVQEAREWITIVGLVEAGLGVSLVPDSFRKLHWGSIEYRPLHRSAGDTAVGLCVRVDRRDALIAHFRTVARRAFGGG